LSGIRKSIQATEARLQRLVIGPAIGSWGAAPGSKVRRRLWRKQIEWKALFQRDAETTTPKTIGWRLSWRGFAVCQNFSNDRRKVINAGARHDDAVPAPMSFLSDTQEFTAVVLPELDVEMLALNLQFFRLDDVVHFALRPPSLGSETLKWKKN